MENQPAGRHQIMTLSRYGRVFGMLCRALTVANSPLTEERTLRPNRVEGLRPMSHPAAGCAAITLEPGTRRSSAHRCRSALPSRAGAIDRDQVIGVGLSPVNSRGFAARTLRPESLLPNRDGHAAFRREADRIYSI
jgi:hypothetical protein